MKLKARNLFFQLTRVEPVDDESGHLLVEGYCFVNPDAGDGFVWKRAAMEAATPDYQAWGAVREMHQALAAGTAIGEANGKPLGVSWDEKGAFLRARIVDPVAVDKVNTGVYRGFSARIKPTFMRGNVVESCIWVENSLVDRPQDKDCPIERFALLRIEPDADAEEFEVEQARASFAEYMATESQYSFRNMALDWLWNALWDIQNGNAEDKGAEVRESCDQFRDFMVTVVEGGQLTVETGDDEGRFVRLEESNGELSRQLTEATTTISALTTERDEATTALTEANAKVAELERRAAPVAKPPVRFPEALDRTIANQTQATDEAKTLREEFKRLSDQGNGRMADADRQAAATRMQVIKARLVELGESL